MRNMVVASFMALGLLTGCNDQVAKDLFQIANVVVNIECGTTRDVATGVITNVLNVVGGNKSDVQKVIDVLETNSAVAKQLCPAVQTIVAAVGTVTSGTPTVVQVAAKSSASPAAEATVPFPVVWVNG